MEPTTNAINWNASFYSAFEDELEFRLNQLRPYIVADLGTVVCYQGPWPAKGPWNGYKP